MRDRSHSGGVSETPRRFYGFCPGDLVHLGGDIGLVIARKTRDANPVILWHAPRVATASGVWLAGIQDAGAGREPGSQFVPRVDAEELAG
jgi:hypothetical protein